MYTAAHSCTVFHVVVWMTSMWYNDDIVVACTACFGTINTKNSCLYIYASCVSVCEYVHMQLHLFSAVGVCVCVCM